MLYPIELWVRPKSTGNYKSNKARASAICAPRSLRGFNRLEPDRLQVQRVPAAFDRTEGQGYLSRRGDFKEADRKSTRLNSSHLGISYAVFCLKKKTTTL